MTKTIALVSLLFLAACGEPICRACRSDATCKLGEVCLQSGPEAGTCARTCSLTVWHVGPGYEAPCAAGVDGCPESCADQAGVFGHCTPAGLPDDVGICRGAAGEPVCPGGRVMLGPGKYDPMCTRVREELGAEAVVLLVINGTAGSGFSMQQLLHRAPSGELLDQINIAASLRVIADALEQDIAESEARHLASRRAGTVRPEDGG